MMTLTSNICINIALFKNQTSLLTAEQIKTAWIDHIYDEKKVTPYGKDNEGYQNYLWVSNQRAHELMLEGCFRRIQASLKTTARRND